MTRTDTERLEWLASKAVIAVWKPREKGMNLDDKLDYLFTNPHAPDRKNEMIRFQIDRKMDEEGMDIDETFPVGEGESP